MPRPTPEQITDARRVLLEGGVSTCEGRAELDVVRTLLAATESPTDEELFPLGEAAFSNACAEDQDDYIEGFFHGARHFLGTPEGK